MEDIVLTRVERRQLLRGVISAFQAAFDERHLDARLRELQRGGDTDRARADDNDVRLDRRARGEVLGLTDHPAAVPELLGEFEKTGQRLGVVWRCDGAGRFGDARRIGGAVQNRAGIRCLVADPSMSFANTPPGASGSSCKESRQWAAIRASPCSPADSAANGRFRTPNVISDERGGGLNTSPRSWSTASGGPNGPVKSTSRSSS